MSFEIVKLSVFLFVSWLLNAALRTGLQIYSKIPLPFLPRCSRGSKEDNLSMAGVVDSFFGLLEGFEGREVLVLSVAESMRWWHVLRERTREDALCSLRKRFARSQTVEGQPNRPDLGLILCFVSNLKSESFLKVGDQLKS
jgi:hypothetical protein